MQIDTNWNNIVLMGLSHTGMSLMNGSFVTMYRLLFVLISVLVLMISLSFHELSHAWSAYRLGDDTAALQGRLSMNPLKHLDPMGSLLFIITSFLSNGRGIGWAKPVPINPARFGRKTTMKQGIALTSLAGPMSNVLLSIISLVALYIVFSIYDLAGVQFSLLSFIIPLFAYMMFFANASLAIFNLLPLPPLDGYKIFGAILPDKIYYKVMGYERYIGMVFLLLVIFRRGVLSSVLGFLLTPFRYLFILFLSRFDWYFIFSELFGLI